MSSDWKLYIGFQLEVARAIMSRTGWLDVLTASVVRCIPNNGHVGNPPTGVCSMFMRRFRICSTEKRIGTLPLSRMSTQVVIQPVCAWSLRKWITSLSLTVGCSPFANENLLEQGSLENPMWSSFGFCEGGCLHKRDSVKGVAFTKLILWRELPSQKIFCKGSYLHKVDSVKGAAFTKGILWRELPSQKGFCEGGCLHKMDSVKGAAFTKGILWRELPSQNGFCEGRCLHKRGYVKGAAFTKWVLWRGAAFTKWTLCRALPSQNGFCEGSCLHKMDPVKWAAFTKWIVWRALEGSCLHKMGSVKGAAFTKWILWRELPSQNGFCEGGLPSLSEGAAFTKGILWR